MNFRRTVIKIIEGILKKIKEKLNMNKSGNTNLKFDSAKNNSHFEKPHVKIFPLENKAPFDISDFKDWDIRIGDYESDTEAYTMKGETMMKIMKIVGIIIGFIALGAFLFFALMLVSTL